MKKEIRMEAHRFEDISQSFPSHFHEHYVIGVVEKGECVLSCRDREYSGRFSDVAQECRTYGQFVENMKDIPEIEFQRRKSPYILQSLSLTALCRFVCCREQLFIIDKKITVFFVVFANRLRTLYEL